jgi:hypothetical protein
MQREFQNSQVPPCQEPLKRLLCLHVQANRKKRRLRLTGPTAGHRDLRIENKLTDEHGDDARLEKGARVEVTVTAKRVDRNA